MQAYLMNFGDNTRVVNDSHNAAVSIGIGELKECDIHDVHFHMIRRAVATETLLIVPKEVRQSERLSAIMSLMRELHTESYDDVLAKYNLLGVEHDDEAPKIRPTRDQMRLMLRDLARQEVAAALRLQSKVVIHEQGDPVTRNRPDNITKELPGHVAPPKEAPAPAPGPDMRAPGDLSLNDPPAKRKAAPKKKKKKTNAKPVTRTIKRERL